MPGFPFAVGGPSRNVNGDPLALLSSIDLRNVPSESHNSINAVSRATGSSSPGVGGTTMRAATDLFVLNLRGAEENS